MRSTRSPAVVMVAIAGLVTACSSGSSDSSSRRGTTTTTTAPTYAARVLRETEVDPSYRQGLARVEGGWIFSVNNGLFRTDDALRQTGHLVPAIPAEWSARGFDHIGDIDVENGVLYAPLEQPDYEQDHQAMLTYDAATFRYTGGLDVTPTRELLRGRRSHDEHRLYDGSLRRRRAGSLRRR